jgi:hypothetical protein
MRFHVVAAVLLATLPLAGCSSSPDTSRRSQNGTQAIKQETKPSQQRQVRHAETSNVLDALDVDALKKKDGGRVRVKGKVYSTHLARSGKVFTLNLGPNWKTCMKAAVFQDDFEKWKGGTDGMKTAYEGKTVVIEGNIKLYQGSPEIVLNTPSQIEAVQE